MDTEVTHSFVQVGGIRIHSAEVGAQRDLTPVVLLHGLNDCHLTWKHIAFDLARDRRVLMPDLPGHGLSDRPDAGYELNWYAHTMSRWLEVMGLDHVDIVGHSLGGGVAQMLLLECSSRVRRLALVSSGGLGREITPLLRLAAIPYVVEWFGQPFMSPCTRLALRGREHVHELCAITARAGSARTFGRTVRDIVNWGGQRRMFFQRAKEVHALPPIAVIWGDKDLIIPFGHAGEFAEMLTGVQVTVLKGCGHYLHHDEPDLFLTTLRSFLDAETASPAKLKPVPRG